MFCLFWFIFKFLFVRNMWNYDKNLFLTNTTLSLITILSFIHWFNLFSKYYDKNYRITDLYRKLRNNLERLENETQAEIKNFLMIVSQSMFTLPYRTKAVIQWIYQQKSHKSHVKSSISVIFTILCEDTVDYATLHSKSLKITFNKRKRAVNKTIKQKFINKER